MNDVNKTLYIPLYGKAYVSRKGLFLDDKKAEEIWQAEGFALKGKSRSKWLAYYMGIRSAVFDDWVRQQIDDTEDAVVIHIGCGMDSRVLRVGVVGHRWYDVDFPEVIQERRRYFSESADYQMIAGDVRDGSWLTSIPEKKNAIVVMEGVAMYLTSKELQDLTTSLCAHFERIALLMDCYTVLAAKMSKYKNPINDVGVKEVYGIDNPELLQHGEFVYVREHVMTPQRYIDQLKGVEKFVFQKLYAGNLSKKLYRLFEYKLL
ncbi:MAG: class I SAM-dependent methyltransferase [Clostridia bacterium]|nr:class I SAM-dependent methyltransferase [Clostridia bacterium]